MCEDHHNFIHVLRHKDKKESCEVQNKGPHLWYPFPAEAICWLRRAIKDSAQNMVLIQLTLFKGTFKLLLPFSTAKTAALFFFLAHNSNAQTL